MKLNSEFRHVMDPRRTRLLWGAFYTVMVILLIGFLYVIANHINTHTAAVGSIGISTPYSKYVVGEPISFTLSNGYNAPIYITNQCPAEPLAVYRQTNGTWLRLHAEVAAASCANQPREVAVPASSSVSTSLSPWQSLFSQPGTYRLVAIVDSYSSLPYVDIQIITPPPPNIVTIIAPQAANHTHAATSSSSQQPQTSAQTVAPSSTSPVIQPPPVTKPAPKTYVLHVTSSGNYDLTSLTLNSGDSLQIIYTKPYNNEVRTHFSPVSPTTAALSSMTVDSENTSVTRVMTTTGTWSYKAADHNGNGGILIVN